jgi:cyclopropane-fatty-acyl-phospholipid synthase
MRSRIYWGHVWHARKQPFRHQFTYPLFMFGINLAELRRLSSYWPLFGHNRMALFSLYDSDYLERSPATLPDKAVELFRNGGVAANPANICLLTMPRFLGYVFNPVSFYINSEVEGQISGMLAEVNNTFGEKHCYLMTQTPSDRLQSEFDKVFFVSPFMEVSGQYSVAVRSFDHNLEISVDLYKGKEMTFASTLKGTASSLNSKTLIYTAIRYPVTAIATMSRIYAQAVRLYFLRRSQVFAKPEPIDGRTLPSRWGFFDRLRLAILGRALKNRGNSNIRPD